MHEPRRHLKPLDVALTHGWPLLANQIHPPWITWGEKLEENFTPVSAFSCPLPTPDLG